jgi:hypothetical protein
MTPLLVNSTTLCWCLHILNKHPNEHACSVDDCACQRFSPGGRTSAHHYRRGQKTAHRRVARLEPGDVLLVGFPGRLEYVCGHDGALVWEQVAGSVTSTPATKHIQDHHLRPVEQKTGALLAWVTGRRMLPTQPRRDGKATPSYHIIETDLGDLPPMFGSRAVLVLVEASRGEP